MKGLNLFVVASEFWEFGIHNIISFVTNNFSLMKTQYRNQSIDLLCKSIDWFLYDKDLSHNWLETQKELPVGKSYIKCNILIKRVSKKETKNQLLQKF